MNDTYLQNMVGVNFKQNPSLRDRYDEYLQSRSVLYILHFSCFSIPLPWVKLDGYRFTQCAYCEVSLDTLGKKFKDPEKRLIGFRVLIYDV